MFKTKIDKEIFLRVLDEWNKLYDPEVCLLKRPFSSPGYHTTLKGGMVHPTRDSLTYAVALLDSGDEKYISRACDITRKMISLQDTNPDNKTYGIWSWFYDEPLEKMAPPDWNWADFCGKELLQIIIDYSDLLSDELKEGIKAAVIHACKSIIKRNMGPGYTNISIMGSFVTHVAGEYFNDKEILTYAKNRLKELFDFNMAHGAFREYNSPTYTIVAIEDIARMLKYIKCEESRQMIEKLNYLAWDCVAKHFHYTTKQWAGPHSRCYQTLQDGAFLYRLQKALEDKVKFIDDSVIKEEYTGVVEKRNSDSIPLDIFRNSAKCPPELMEYFVKFNGDHDANCKYVKAIDGEHEQTAFTYMTEDYALSCFEKSNFWNQLRALLCYFGDDKNPISLHLRCLHDFYDYSSGAILSNQIKGTVASVVNFSTNGGDTHCNLDMVKDATIKAKDLRLRYEVCGNGVDSLIDVKDELQQSGRIILSTDKLKLCINVPYAKFGENNIEYAVTKQPNSIFIDIILYSGNETNICFTSLNEAVIGLTLQLSKPNEKFSTASYSLKNSSLSVSIDKCSVTGGITAKTFDEIYYGII